MNSRLLRAFALLTLVLSALLVAACGEDSSSGGNASADPASLAPASSPLYFEAYAKPADNQKAALDKLVSKVAGDRDLGEDIKKAIDKSIQADPKDKDRSFAKDIEPWLGDRIGVFIASLDFALGGASGSSSDPPFGVVVATKDAGKAQDELNDLADESKDPKGEYKGVKYRSDDQVRIGVVGDFLVIAEKKAFEQAVDVEKGAGGLGASAHFKEATDTLPEDRLGFGYVDGKALVDAAIKSGALPAGAQSSLKAIFGSATEGTVTFSAVAKDDGVLVEAATPAQPGRKTTDLLGELPGDSWLAIASPDIGANFEKTLEAISGLGKGAGSGGPNPADVLQQAERETGIDIKRDITSWLGDTAFYATGSNLLNLSAGVIIKSKDTAASARALVKLRALVAKLGADQGLRVRPTEGGFTVNIQGAPGPVEVVQRGDKVVLAYGSQAVDRALSPSEKLADASSFKAAQASIGADIDVSGFISFAPILALAESLGAGSSSDYKAAKPYLDALDALVFGSKTQGDKAVGRFLLKVK